MSVLRIFQTAPISFTPKTTDSESHLTCRLAPSFLHIFLTRRLMKQSLHPYHENPGTIFLLGCLIFFVLTESLQLSGSLFFGSFRDCLDLPIDGVFTTSIYLPFQFFTFVLAYLESYKYPPCPQVHFTPFPTLFPQKLHSLNSLSFLLRNHQSFHSLSTLSQLISKITKHSFP